MPFFWLNALKDSSDKFKWMASSEDLSYTNWKEGLPRGFGKWMTTHSFDKNNFFCETYFDNQ